MRKPTLTRAQAWGWQDLMVVAAVRYCLGRQTYIVGVCCNWLIDIWPLLSEKDRHVIQRDIEAEFERDDAARERGEQYRALGADCDRADWERVRALWGGGT